MEINEIHLLFAKESRMLGRNLSAAEIARKVFSDREMTLHDKKKVWRGIIVTMPDESVQVKGFEAELPEELSLHALLQDYLAEAERLEAMFYCDEPDVVYLPAVNEEITGEWFSDVDPFLDWKSCYKELNSLFSCFSQKGRLRGHVTKFYPKQYVDDFMKQITAEFSETGELLEIGSRMTMTIPRYRDLLCKMESLPLIEPPLASVSPRKGDIVSVKEEALQQYPGLPKPPLLFLYGSNTTGFASVYYLNNQLCPDSRVIDFTLIEPYRGPKNIMPFLLLREIGDSLAKDLPITCLQKRIGAAFTYYVEGAFSLDAQDDYLTGKECYGKE